MRWLQLTPLIFCVSICLNVSVGSVPQPFHERAAINNRPYIADNVHPQTSDKANAPSIVISLLSKELSKDEPAIVKVRVENNSNAVLDINGPLTFKLAWPTGDASERERKSYLGSVYLADLTSNDPGLFERGTLAHGESLVRDVDLKKLKWGRANRFGECRPEPVRSGWEWIVQPVL